MLGPEALRRAKSMFLAEERNEMTPAQLIQVLTNKPRVGLAIILHMKPGVVLIAVGRKEGIAQRFINFEGVPLFCITDDLTVEQWTQTVKEGQDYFANHGPLTAFQLVIDFVKWLNTQPMV